MPEESMNSTVERSSTTRTPDLVVLCRGDGPLEGVWARS